MVFDILNSPIALLYPVRYEILADIESFAFLLTVPLICEFSTLGVLLFFEESK